MMKINPVGWFDIYVSDMVRARKFYEGLLSIEFTAFMSPMDSDMEMLMFPLEGSVYGAGGALVKHSMRGPSSGGTLVYFSVADCGERSEWAQSQGQHIIVPRTSIGEEGYISVITDPEGNNIGLHSHQ